MVITAVDKGSPAARAGVRAGDTLLAVDGKEVRDVLDYRFMTYEASLTLTLRDNAGRERFAALRHPVGGDLGLTFETYLMDEERTCQNNCVFCFIDQMPKGCRSSLYVKDDDARLSFLLGNYITLTNLTGEEIDRICRMRISPLGISIHTTDPALRVRMLRNKRAGALMDILRRFDSAGVTVNGQIVLCPGYNDGQALVRTLEDLRTLSCVDSVSVVPVGLTGHREGLPPLEPVTPEMARAAIDLCVGYTRVFCADELYLLAGLPLPTAPFYEEFPQLENGVGMLALFAQEFFEARDDRPVVWQTLATGRAAAGFMETLLAGTRVQVLAVDNVFFGGGVTVAGLLTGRDLAAGLKGCALGARVLIPKSCLRHGTDVFLDGVTVAELEEMLGVPVTPVDPDGAALWRALGENTE